MPVEMEEHNKKGHCYNCNEKFALGHHCAIQKWYILDANVAIEPLEEAFEDAMIDIKEEPEQPTKCILEVSCNSLYGFISP